MASADLVMNLLARDSASAAINKVANAADKMGRQTTRANAAQRRASSTFRTARNIMTGLAASYAAVKVVQFSKDSIRASSDLQEQVSATGAVFKKQQAQILAWGDTAAQTFGTSRREALQFANSFGTLGNSIGLTQKRNVGFSKTLAELSADMASFKNTSIPEAAEALSAGLVGETEPLRKYGIFLNDAKLKAKAFEMGLHDGKSVLDEHSKALAAYEIIMETATKTNMKGDFPRTAQNYANSVRTLQANVEDLQGVLGAPLMAGLAQSMVGFNKALPDLRKKLGKGDGLAKGFQEVGKAAGDAAVWAVDNFDEIKEVASNVGDAMKTVAGAVENVWGVLGKLPPGAKEALATMAIVGGIGKKTGVLALGKGIGSLAAKAMNVNAGVVNVNGGKGVPGVGGKTPPAAAVTPKTVALNPVTIAAVVTAAATAWNWRQNSRDNRAPVPIPAPGPVTVPGNAGRPSVSKGNRDADWIDFGKQQRAMDTYSQRLSALGRQWDGVHGKIKQGTGIQTRWGDAAKAATLKGTIGATAMAGAVAKIPDKKATKVGVDGADEAKGRVKGLSGAIGAVKSKRVKVDETGADPSRGRVEKLDGSIQTLKGKKVEVGQSGAEQAKAAIDNLRTTISLLQSKTVDIVTRYRTEGGGPGKPANVATGGLIRGPGTSTSDSIPAMLSNREFVQPAASVSYYGVGFMEALRTRRLPRPVGFAKGGEVAKGVKAARADAAWQARLAKAAARYGLSDSIIDLLGGMDRPVAKALLPTGRPRSKAAKRDRRALAAMAKQSNAVARLQQQRAAKRDGRQDFAAAMAEWGQWDEARGFAGMTPDLAIKRAQDKIAAAKRVRTDPKATDAQKAKAYRDEMQWVERLEEAQQRLTEAEQARQDAALDKVNQVRDAIESQAQSYRQFAAIVTVSAEDATDAQQKVADAQTKVDEARKRFDLAGNDRDRARAAKELAAAELHLTDAQKARANVSDKITGSSIRATMGSKLAKLRAFADAVRRLKDAGLNAVTLQDVLAAGPEQGLEYAKALLEGGIGEVNTLQGQINTESASLGLFGANVGNAATSIIGQVTDAVAGISVSLQPAPVTLTLDGQTIAQALLAYQRQAGV